MRVIVEFRRSLGLHLMVLEHSKAAARASASGGEVVLVREDGRLEMEADLAVIALGTRRKSCCMLVSHAGRLLPPW